MSGVLIRALQIDGRFAIFDVGEALHSTFLDPVEIQSEKIMFVLSFHGSIKLPSYLPKSRPKHNPEPIFCRHESVISLMCVPGRYILTGYVSIWDFGRYDGRGILGFFVLCFLSTPEF